MFDDYATFKAARIVGKQTFAAERALDKGEGTHLRAVQLAQRVRGTRLEAAGRGTAINRLVDEGIGGQGNTLGLQLQQPLGVNARGNAIFPDYQLTLNGTTSVIDMGVATLERRPSTHKFRQLRPTDLSSTIA